MGGMLGSIGADDDLQQIIEAGDGDVLEHGFASASTMSRARWLLRRRFL